MPQHDPIKPRQEGEKILYVKASFDGSMAAWGDSWQVGGPTTF